MDGSRATFFSNLRESVTTTAQAVIDPSPPPQGGAGNVTMNNPLHIDLIQPPSFVGSISHFQPGEPSEPLTTSRPETLPNFQLLQASFGI